MPVFTQQQHFAMHETLQGRHLSLRTYVRVRKVKKVLSSSSMQALGSNQATTHSVVGLMEYIMACRPI